MKRMLNGSRSIKRGALFACAGLLATLLAACGGAAAATPTRVPTIAAPTSAPTAAAAPTKAAPTEAAAPTKAAPTEAAAPTKAAAPTEAAAAPTTAPIGVGGTIALLLPETKTTRYETADRPDFEQQFKQLCPNCTIIYSNANQDANAPLTQAEAALTNGAKVLVLDPVDSQSAA